MWSGWTRIWWLASSTGIAVTRASNWVSALGCSGSRCCTSTKAMPVSVGRCARSSVKASSPPADAPMPTMGKPAGGAGFAGGEGASRTGVRLGMQAFVPPLLKVGWRMVTRQVTLNRRGTLRRFGPLVRLYSAST